MIVYDAVHETNHNNNKNNNKQYNNVFRYGLKHIHTSMEIRWMIKIKRDINLIKDAASTN